MLQGDDTVDLLDFGADPTGEKNSRVAFGTAIATLTLEGGTIYVPPGNYNLTTAPNGKTHGRTSP
jgi:polygalacturonase